MMRAIEALITLAVMTLAGVMYYNQCVVEPVPNPAPVALPIDYAPEIERLNHNIKVLEKRINFLAKSEHQRAHLPTIYGAIR